jgi:hypothetical protein
VNKSWDPNAAGTCLPSGPSFKAYAWVSIVSDIIVTVLLIPFVVKLNINKNRKIGLCAVFLLGLFTTVCSILRYLQIDRVAYGDGNSTMLVLWGTIEFNVGVSCSYSVLLSRLTARQNMVSSLPFLAPVVLRKAKEYKEYRSKQLSTWSNHRSGKEGTWEEGIHYRLRSLSQGNAVYAVRSGRDVSQGDMLVDVEKLGTSITKTMGYAVQEEGMMRSGGSKG